MSEKKYNYLPPFMRQAVSESLERTGSNAPQEAKEQPKEEPRPAKPSPPPLDIRGPRQPFSPGAWYQSSKTASEAPQETKAPAPGEEEEYIIHETKFSLVETTEPRALRTNKTTSEPPEEQSYAARDEEDAELINIQLTNTPQPVEEPEEILSALPTEPPPFEDYESKPPEPAEGELISNIPKPLLLDDLKRADFTQRFYNFGRQGHTAAQPLSAGDWKQEAEQVLLWKALRLQEELKRLASQGGEAFTDEEIESLSRQEISNMDPQLIHAIAPLSPEGNDTRSLAVWLMDVFGLESYERNSFWSRCFPSRTWRNWFGTEVKYKTGFIYEPVSEALLLRKLQDVSDSQTFTTSNGDKVGKLTLNKRDDILKELRQMLDPEGGGAASIFANRHPQAGFATSEEVPKWISVGPGYQTGGSWEVSSRPVEISDRATFVVPCVYDPQADCPNFKAFLNETFEGAEDKQERIDALLEWIAAAIFGETTRRAKALYLYGYTATGKSVVCELVKLFFPNQHQSALGFDDLEDKVAVGELSQSRLNVMGEAAKSGAQKSFGSSTFKSAVSGDEIRCNVKFRPGFKFRPNTAFLYAANGRMPLNDCDDSIFRRLIIIHFENPVPVERQDPDLIEKFRSELSGILNLILEAAVAMMPRNNLLDPASSKALKRRWAGQVNSVKAFLDEECRFIPDLWTNKAKYSRKQKDFSTPISQLHRAYKNWCVVDGLKAVGIREFRNRLDGLGIKTKDLSDGTRVPILMLDPDKFREGLRLA